MVKMPKASPVTPSTKSKSAKQSGSSSDYEESSDEKTKVPISKKKETPKAKNSSPVKPSAIKSKGVPSGKQQKQQQKPESSSESEDSSSSSSEAETNVSKIKETSKPKNVPVPTPVTPSSGKQKKQESEGSSESEDDSSSSSSSSGKETNISQKKETPKAKSVAHIAVTPNNKSGKKQEIKPKSSSESEDSDASSSDSEESDASSSEAGTNVSKKKETPKAKSKASPAKKKTEKPIPVQDSSEEDEESEDDESSHPVKKEKSVTSEEDSSISDDEKTEKQKSRKSESNSVFKNSLERDFGLQPVALSSSHLTAEELSSKDYEIWTITTPSQMDARKLQDLELSLSKSTKFKADNAAYQTILHHNPAQMDFILPDKANKFKFVSREAVGNISIITDVIPISAQKKSAEFCNKIPIELPQGLKRRHPIYGDSHQLKELQIHWAKSSGAERDTSKVEHKKKKKDLKREIEEEVAVVEPKKKKKKKHSL